MTYSFYRFFYLFWQTKAWSINQWYTGKGVQVYILPNASSNPIRLNNYLHFLIHFVRCSKCCDLILACLMCQKMFAGYARSTGTQIFSICLRISGMRGAEQARGFYHIWNKLCNIKIDNTEHCLYFGVFFLEKDLVVCVASMLVCCPVVQRGRGCVWSRQLISVPTLREGQLIGIV